MDDVVAVERELAAYYDQEAAARAGRPLEERRVEVRDAFIASIADLEGPIVEVGPGAGRDAAAFVDVGLRVIGIDLSVEQLREARRVGAEAVVGSVRALPLADASAAAVWTMSTLMHVPSAAILGALDEVRRVLAPGARAVIGVWGGPDVESRSPRDTIQPPRLFSRRSDERWTAMLGRIGVVERFEAWPTDEGDFWYQFATVRRE
jgi:SAM-dependent methyltransferase